MIRSRNAFVLAVCLILSFGYIESQTEYRSKTEYRQSEDLLYIPGIKPHAQPSLSSYKFHVVCDLQGKHGSDPDRLDYKREMFLASWWLKVTYPMWPSEIQGIARRSLFVVNHRQVAATKVFAGWSAEDDEDWAGDSRLWFEGGTIKVNISERTIQYFDFVYTYVYPQRSDNPKAWLFGKELMFGGFGHHEVLHEAQYMIIVSHSRLPVQERDFTKNR